MAQNVFLETNRFCLSLKPWLAGSAMSWSVKCRVLTPRGRAQARCDFTRGHGQTDRQTDRRRGRREGQRRVRLRLRKFIPWRETTPASARLLMTQRRSALGRWPWLGLRSRVWKDQQGQSRLSGKRGQMRTLNPSSSVPPGGGGCGRVHATGADADVVAVERRASLISQSFCPVGRPRAARSSIPCHQGAGALQPWRRRSVWKPVGPTVTVGCPAAPTSSKD